MLLDTLMTFDFDERVYVVTALTFLTVVMWTADPPTLHCGWVLTGDMLLILPTNYLQMHIISI